MLLRAGRDNAGGKSEGRNQDMPKKAQLQTSIPGRRLCRRPFLALSLNQTQRSQVNLPFWRVPIVGVGRRRDLSVDQSWLSNRRYRNRLTAIAISPGGRLLSLSPVRAPSWNST